MKHIPTAYEWANTWANPAVKKIFDTYKTHDLLDDWVNSEAQAIWCAMSNTGDEDDPHNPGPYTSWVDVD